MQNVQTPEGGFETRPYEAFVSVASLDFEVFRGCLLHQKRIRVGRKFLPERVFRLVDNLSISADHNMNRAAAYCEIASMPP